MSLPTISITNNCILCIHGNNFMRHGSVYYHLMSLLNKLVPSLFVFLPGCLFCLKWIFWNLSWISIRINCMHYAFFYFHCWVVYRMFLCVNFAEFPQFLYLFLIKMILTSGAFVLFAFIRRWTFRIILEVKEL